MNNVQLYGQPPMGAGSDRIDAALQAQLAQALASGDPRMAVKQYDRGGLSRGRAQWNQAGIDSAQNVVSGIADAYSNQIKNQAYDSNLQLQGQQDQEQTAQALGGLQQQSDYARQLAALQRQQTMMGFANNLLGGLLR